MQAHLPSVSSILTGEEAQAKTIPTCEEAQAKRRAARPVTAQLLDELNRPPRPDDDTQAMVPSPLPFSHRPTFTLSRSSLTDLKKDFACRVLQIPISELTVASDMPCDKATVRVAIAVSGALAASKPGFSLVKQRFEAYENTTGRAQAEMAYTLFRCGLGDPSFWSDIEPAVIVNAFNASEILSEVPSSEDQYQPLARQARQFV